jgi:AcrR family transcriptional regulator
MMTRKESNTRGNRTRATLQRAFKALLRTKPYESIAVDEICKLANVGRSTFYTHFRSKDDLKRSGLETLRRLLHDRQRKPVRSDRKEQAVSLSFTFDLFAHAHDHLDHYRMLANGRGRTIILRKLKDTATELLRAQFNAGPTTKSHDAIEREATVQCVAGAFMALLTWWLDRGATIPTERIDAMFQRFVCDGAL